MKNQIKAKGIKYLSFLIIFMCVYFSLLNFRDFIDYSYIVGITVFISMMVSPKTRVVETESGKKKIQITWIFLKNPKLI